MGKPIVYCQGCGKSLREEEFDRGQAHVVENRPYCVACKPIEKAAASPDGTSKRSAPPPLIRPGSSTRLSVPAVIPPAPRESRTALYVGGGLAGAALVLLIIILASGGSSPEAPPPKPVDSPRTGTTSPKTDSEPEALAALERLAASSTDPDAIFAQCRKARQTVTSSRWESRIRKVEDRATELKMERERRSGQQLDPFLAQIRRIIQDDPQCGRRAEVERMLDSARKIAGARASEVDQVLAEYRKKCDEVPRKAAEEAQAEARQLAAQKKYDEALARLERYLGEFPGTAHAGPVEKLHQEIGNEMRADAILVRAGADGIFLLTADRADRKGGNIQLKGGNDPYLGNWHKVEDGASWTIENSRPGKYRMELSYACNKGAGGEYAIGAGGAEVKLKMEPTGGDWKKYVTGNVGQITLPGGRFVLAIRALSIKGDGLMNLKSLRLIPE